jgi:Na+-transporting NADH:ubiquinone oxidoreductase subunit NqrF
MAFCASTYRPCQELSRQRQTPETADVAVSKAAVENAAVRSALLELGVTRERIEIILSDDGGKITNR